MSSFLIYVFIDEKKIPFYVGISKNFKQRKRSHLYEVKNGNTLYKYNKLRKVLSQNLTIDDVMVVIEDDISCDEIDLREIEFIAELRKKGYKLTNLTNGGEGAINTIPGLSEKLRKIHTGSKRSKETRRKISEAKKGMKFSKTHKKHLSDARKKRKISSQTRLKMSETSKGKVNIKKYKLTDPEGNTYITKNGLTQFCEEHGLSSPNFYKVLNEERKHNKGWTIERM